MKRGALPSFWSRASYTLVEVLVVMAIVGVLAAFLIPALSSARERGRSVTCLNNIRQLTFAHMAFADDHRHMMCTANDALTTEPPGWLQGTPVPTVVTNSILIQYKYLSGPECFKCPSDKGIRTDPQAIQPPLFSYARNGEILGLYPDAASQVQPDLDTIKTPSKTFMLMELADSHPFNDGSTMRWPGDHMSDRHLGLGAVSFFDGHAVLMTASDYNSLAPDDRVAQYLYPE